MDMRWYQRQLRAVVYCLVVLGSPWSVTCDALAQYGGPYKNMGFHDINSRLYTDDGDWAVGSAKGECGPGYEFGAGVSTHPNHLWTYSLLCVPASRGQVNYSRGTTVTYWSDGPAGPGLPWGERRDLSTGEWYEVTNVGDHWDSVLECGENEVMTGLAQSTTAYFEEQGSSYAVPKITEARCSPLVGAGSIGCSAVEFASGHGNEGGDPQDWSPGFLKATCGEGRYMKGIANRFRKDVDWDNGGPLGFDTKWSSIPVAILCCTAAPKRAPHF